MGQVPLTLKAVKMTLKVALIASFRTLVGIVDLDQMEWAWVELVWVGFDLYLYLNMSDAGRTS